MQPDSSIVSPRDALKSAIDIAGGQAALARLRNVAQPTVWGWLHRIGYVPAEHVLGVEADTGVSRHDLRPDIYPRDTVPPTVPGSGVAGGAGGVSSTPARADTDDRTPDSLSGLTA